MKMEIRAIDLEKDYPILTRWWKSHDWQPVAKEVLPPLGYVVCQKERMLMAGFLYTAGLVSWFEWIVSNPDTTGRETIISLDMLVDHVGEVCKEKGILVTFHATNVKSLIKRLESKGYSPEEGITLLTKINQEK